MSVLQGNVNPAKHTASQKKTQKQTIPESYTDPKMLRFLVTLVAGVVIGVFAVMAAKASAEEAEHHQYHQRPSNRKRRPSFSDVPKQPSQFCVICTDNFGDAQLEQLPCGHIYHGKCLIQWLNTNRTCPICRHALTKEQQDTYKQRNRA